MTTKEKRKELINLILSKPDKEIRPGLYVTKIGSKYIHLLDSHPNPNRRCLDRYRVSIDRAFNCEYWNIGE